MLKSLMPSLPLSFGMDAVDSGSALQAAAGRSLQKKARSSDVLRYGLELASVQQEAYSSGLNSLWIRPRDEANWECLAFEVRMYIPSAPDVRLEQLDRLLWAYPDAVRMDNGPEMNPRRLYRMGPLPKSFRSAISYLASRNNKPLSSASTAHIAPECAMQARSELS
ncbi:hypothetical protein [Achromobacter sp. ESBL13]|uniref:hypothetical protein n=1 Tax=Achromobacter sp. ESBL13 TaxID=3077328 RepID=UPI002FC61144